MFIRIGIVFAILFIAISHLTGVLAHSNVLDSKGPGIAVDFRGTTNPKNPASFSGIHSITLPEKEKPLLLFHRMKQMPVQEGHKTILERQPMSGLKLELDGGLSISDSNAIESIINAVKLLESSVDSEDTDDIVEVLVDIVERIPFGMDGAVNMSILTNTMGLSITNFNSAIAAMRKEDGYFFRTESGKKYTISKGVHWEFPAAPLAIGGRLKFSKGTINFIHLIPDEDYIIATGGISGEYKRVSVDVGMLAKISNNLNFGLVIENLISKTNWQKLNDIEGNVMVKVDGYPGFVGDDTVISMGLAQMMDSNMFSIDLRACLGNATKSSMFNLHACYGRQIGESAYITISGYSDVKRRFVLDVDLDYTIRNWSVGINMGSADMFQSSLITGIILKSAF